MSARKNHGITRRELIGGLSAIGAYTALGLPAIARGESNKHSKKEQGYPVNIFLGTGGHGHTYPGATVPFGMVQLSPDTYNDDWDWCSGYHSTDTSIMGFSHTHLSGTGCGDLLDFLVMPRIGEVHLEPGDRKDPSAGYRSTFDKKTEVATPGYYSVLLADSGITAELTATEHAGLHRYTFPASDSAHVIVDLTHVYGQLDRSLGWCSAQISGNDTLLLGHMTNAWGTNREMYAAMQFSKPFGKVDVYLDGKLVESPSGETRGKNVKLVIHYKTTADEKLHVKTGISGTGTAGAQKNLKAEIPSWDFRKIQTSAAHQWQDQLGKIQIESSRPDPDLNERTLFYTSLYHSMLGPTLFDDVDGLYRGMDGKNHQLDHGQRNYTTYSLWDTYRAEHPLFTLIHADRVPDMVNSLILMAEQSPAGMPVWPLQGTETGTMTGYHSASVMAEACAKNFSGIDWNRAYKVMHKRAFVDDYRGLNWYRKLGYIPCDLEEESVSKTLEYDYNDWGVAHVAARVGQSEDANFLLKRSRNYRNFWDQSTGFLRPKFENGSWSTPFDPIDMGHSSKWRDYTESNAWQTTFGVQHDVTSYIELLGGDQAFVAKLDQLFDGPSTLPKDAPPDIAGMIGQYAHGNEPSHHIAYLYAFAGQPHKTQQRIHQIVTTLYSNSLDGIAGNEDCGQMSAWFILSAIGFYSVDPVSTKYIIGTPLYDRVTLNLAGGKKLIIEARRESAESIYINSAELDGKPHSKSWFHHADVERGGHFVFDLKNQPNEKFGASVEDRPKSELTVSA
ncbi:GH92 family glycosyl hydrolase [Acidicapsa ligni]|uniref:GH92 family glycosyl hydrolase n=1 Tax=Acidicapsa ligni TaxID=542300 RepID=UPI0021E05652|nr:GH92 family glycosyl hydrolase [Acidicapsa ligni]